MIGSAQGSSRFQIDSVSSQDADVPLSLGLTRTGALEAILSRIVRRLQAEINPHDSLEASSSKLAMSCFLVELMSYFGNFRSAHSELYHTLVTRGLAMLQKADKGSQVYEELLSSLRNLAVRSLFSIVCIRT